MTDEILNIILPAATGTAGVLLTKAYDKYLKSKDKRSKVNALSEMYNTLENLYSEDLQLQKKLNTLAKENENLKNIIEELKNGSN